MAISNHTPKCLEFSKRFKNEQGITTHQAEDEQAHYFSAAVYLNGNEFICLDETEENKYMVYINNPNGYEGKQLIFAEYKTFGMALRKAEAIVGKREYPKPILIW